MNRQEEIKSYEINDGHYLELLDRLHVAGSNIETHIRQHPLTEMLDGRGHRAVLLIDDALEKIAEAYQLIGSIMPEETN